MNTNFEVIGLTRLKESNPSPEVDVRESLEGCGEVCWGVGGGEENVERGAGRCGEVCWGEGGDEERCGEV